jgi:hypothetical protein
MVTFFIAFYLLYSQFVSIFVNMENQIFIPQKLKVGYQKRNDTYSKKLAYVIYYDEKGKLRKETSWKGWIKPSLGIDEFENVPTEGFVLNKNVGGVKNSYRSWNSDVRIEKVRVYDPRGFEFEIDIPNVLSILQECTSTKGKGLEGTFVYGWVGAALTLIPTDSQEYRDAIAYTEIQGHKVEIKDLIEGASYKTKKLKDLVYLGRFEWFEEKYNRRKGEYEVAVSKKHVFADMNPDDDFDDYEEDEEDEMTIDDFKNEKEYQKHLERTAKDKERWAKEREKEKAEALANPTISFITLGSTATLAKCISDTPVSNYAELLDKFSKTKNASMPAELIETPATPKPEPKQTRWDIENKDKKAYYIKNSDGSYTSVRVDVESDWNHKTDKEIFKGFKLDFDYKYSIDKEQKFVKKYVRYDDRPKKYENKVYTADQIKGLGLIGLNVRLTNNKVVNLEKYLGGDE